VQLVSKISNLCGPDPPTSETDRQTDDMQSQCRAMHFSASRGKNEKQRRNNSDARSHLCFTERTNYIYLLLRHDIPA